MRKTMVVLATAAMVSGLVLATPMTQSASAISEGVHFSADDLPTWRTNGTVWALGQAHGKVVAGGTFSQVLPPSGGSGTPLNLNGLAILDADTGAPSSCQMTLAMAGATPTIRTAVTSPDGNTVYIGGNFSHINGVVALRAAAIDPVNCTVKPFRVRNISSYVYDLSVTEDTVYMAGSFLSVDGQQRQRYAAVDATTGDLLPWVANADATGWAVQASPDRTKVAIGGDFFNVNGENSHSIAVVDAATGDTLRNYPLGFITRTSITKEISTDETAFYVGNEGTGGGVFDGSFKVDWNTLDEVWRDNCLGATQVILPYKGTLYKAHHHHDCGTENAFQDGKRIYLSAHDPADSQMYGWFPTLNDGVGEHIGPRAMVVSTGNSTGKDYLWVGGEYTLVNGKSQQSLTRFGPDDTGAPPTVLPVAEAMSNGTVQVKFRTVYDTDDSLLTYRVYRNGSSTPMWTGTASSMWWVRPQVTVIDDNVTPGTNYTYRVTASDGPNTSNLSPTASARAVSAVDDYASRVISDGSQMYWRYDGTTGPWVLDSAGATTTGYNGLAQNGVSYSAAGAIAGDSSATGVFNGSNSYIWNDQLEPAPDTYTIETWIKTDTTRGGKIVGYGNGRPNTGTQGTRLSGNYDRHVYMDNSGRLNFGVWAGGAQLVRSSAQYNDNQWHHIVATQGPAGLVLYVDGIKVGQNPATAGQPYWGVWHVGGDQLNGWPNKPSSNFFQGQIDETAIYAAPLTARQAAEHYRLGGGAISVNPVPADAYGAAVYTAEADLYWRLDETSGSVAADASYFGQNSGQYGNAVTLGQPALVANGQSIRTAGDPNSVVAQAQPGSPSAVFSAETWFKTDTAGGKILGFENAQTGNGNSYDKQIYMTDSGSLIFGVYTGSTQTLVAPADYSDNTWHHVVGTQDASGMKLYVDGALIDSNQVTTNQAFSGYWRAGGGNLGSWPDAPSNFYFTGQVDEVAIYSAALAGTAVAEHYSLGINDTVAPSMPQNVVSALNGEDAEVSWDASTDNVGVANYVVYRSDDAGFTVDETNKVGEVTDTTFVDTTVPFGTTYYRVVAVDAAGNRSAASAAAEVTVLDQEAPSVPQDVTATVTDSTVALSWPPSTDNVAVTGYAVHRGTSLDFEADAASKIADVPGENYSDTGLVEGTYYYKIVAIDAAANASAPSASVEAVVLPGPPPPPVVVTVNPSADAMVYQVNPNSNYGSANQLSSRGGSSNIASYLAFDLPAAPAGRVLTAATLDLRTSTDATATSADLHTVHLQDGIWSENTVTWNNRPTPVGDEVGVLAGAPSSNTNYTITLDAARLRTLTGPQTLALVSEGGDNLRVWSRESSIPVYRPILTLSYETGTLPPDTEAPSTPADVTTAVTDTDVTLSWAASTDNVAVAGYTVYRSTDSGFAADASSKVADVAGTSYTDSGLAVGTYYYRVTASDAAENVSAASAAVEAVTTDPPLPDTEDPSTPGGVTTSVTGSAVALSWTASTDNVAVTGYAVYRGTASGFVTDASSKVADVTGTSYTNSGLAAGTYYYKVTAVDAAGNVSAASAAVEAVVNEPPGEPVVISVDPSADAMVYQVNPNSNYGSNIQLSSRGGSSQIASFLSFNMPDAPTGMLLTEASLQLRTSTDPTAGSTDTHTINLVAGTWSENTITWNNRPTPIGDQLGAVAGAPAVNTNYSIDLDAIRMRALTGQQSLALVSDGTDNLRTWSREAANSTYRPVLTLTYEEGSVPPDTEAPATPSGLSTSAVGGDVTVAWDASTDNVGVTGYTVFRGTDSGFVADSSSKVADVTGTSHTDSGLAAGTYYYKVTAVDAAGNVSAASAAVEAVATEPPPPDTEAPSVPADIVTSADGADVTVSWVASTDNVAVTGYAVYRGTDTGFVADASSKVADETGTSYTDSALAAATYYYKVTASDAAGNTSDPSAAAEATVVAPPPAPVVLTVNPAEDAMVYQVNANSNYGSNNQLSSRGGSSQIASYLAFNLPAAPAGTVLTGATLTVRTSTDPTAGSADAHALNLVAGGWGQSTITWNNRPTALGSQLGELTGATNPNTPQTIELTVAQLKDLVGSGVSMALTSAGNDNLRLWSNEAGNTTYRPLLTLTFTQE